MTITYKGTIPSVNHYWKFSIVKGKIFAMVSKEGREFKKIIGQLAKLNGAKNHSKGVVVQIQQHHKGLGRIDLDNISKGILDALSGICYKDDKQVEKIILTKHRHSTFDGCVITVEGMVV